MKLRAILAATTAAGLLLVAGCSDDASSGATGTSANASANSAKATGTVTVFAAASLTEAFTTIGKDFEGANPGAKVTFNFAGSSALATQITQGAPADVFASASPTNMTSVTDAGDNDSAPITFVKNQLVIAVAKGNPKHLAGLAGLGRSDLKVALCAEAVPCGSAAKKALAAAGVSVTPVTQEQDVKAALSKVKLGEVDAALVYRTDAKAATSSVDGIEFPESGSAINEYPIAVLKNAPNKPGAAAFVAYVASEAARKVLTAAGFQTP